MRIAICDDVPECVRSIEKCLARLLEPDDVWESHADGAGLINAHREEPFDLVFLDVEMPGLNGIELGIPLRSIYRHTRIVYVTRYRDHAVEAFALRAAHYLVKPVKASALADIVAETRELFRSRSRGYLEIGWKQSRTFVDLDDIHYIESYLNRQMIHSVAGIYQCRNSMKGLEAELGGRGFCRIHRSYIVNLDCILRIDERQITLKTQAILPLGTTKEPARVYAALSEWRPKR